MIYLAPSHFLNQCCVIINWTLGNKLQWIFNQNTKIFIHENASENIVCELAAILSRGKEWKSRTLSGMITISKGHIFLVTGPLKGESTGGFPSQRQWRRDLMFSLIDTWTNYWTNIQDAGDLRCQHARYDVTVMTVPADVQVSDGTRSTYTALMTVTGFLLSFCSYWLFYVIFLDVGKSFKTGRAQVISTTTAM